MSDLNQAFAPFLQGQFFKDLDEKCIKFRLNQEKDLNSETLKTKNKSHSAAIKQKFFEDQTSSLESFIQAVYNSSKSRSAKISAASRRRKLSALKNFSQWCLEQKLIASDPLLSAPSSKLAIRLPEYLNLEEVMNYSQSLLQDFDKNPTKFKNELILFLILYGCGLRIEEACNIKTKDLDWSQSRISILGKGNKHRFAVLPEFAKLKLEKLLDPNSTYIFGAKPLVTRTAYNWVKKRGLKAGLHKPVHPHMFRHTYATHLLREKTDLRHLQELLGHSSLAATERYTHLDKDQLLQSLENFHPLSK